MCCLDSAVGQIGLGFFTEVGPPSPRVCDCGYMQWEGNNSLAFPDFLSWMVFPGAEKWGLGECLGQKRKLSGISGHFCACGNPSSVCPSSSRPPLSHWVPALSKNNQVTKRLLSVLLSVLSQETACLKGVDMAKLSSNRNFSFQLKKGSTRKSEY